MAAENKIFPRDSSKTYGLMALVRGESSMVDRGPEDTVFAFPIVALLEALLALGTGVVVLLFSLLKNAPLEELANPAVTTNPAKAPWYFVGLQELLEHMHPTLAGVIIPGLLVAFLVVLPYMDHEREGVGRWFGSQRGRLIVLSSAVYTMVVMPLLIVLDNLFSVRESLRGVGPDWVAQFAIPALALVLAVALPVAILRRWRPTSREVMLVLFTVMIVSALVFTVSGFLFRGPGFRLYWPWQMPDGYNPFDSL